MKEMSDILFSGKRLDNDKWVEGYYVCLNGKKHVIYTGYAEVDCDCYYPDSFEVNPETVRRYTGVTDKNGRKIFEGDIVAKYSNYWGKRINSPVVFEMGVFFMKYDEKSGMPLCDVCEKIEVIGNIYENPEMLKGGD